MTGVIATTVVAHVPTLGLAKNTPEYQQTLVAAERAMGAHLRNTLKPDLWVVISTHWVATFDWLVTMHAMHDGVCVADEAPSLISGVPYKFRGDPEFANALIEGFSEAEIPSARNDSPHYEWDYGTFVPLQYIDPDSSVPVVCLPSVLMANHEECLRAGAAVHATAKRLGRRAVFVTSSAFSHVLARGRQNWPTPERVAADHRFINRLKEGALQDAIGGFTEYSRFVGAEMGGRPLATMLGVAGHGKGRQGHRGPPVRRLRAVFRQRQRRAADDRRRHAGGDPLSNCHPGEGRDPGRWSAAKGGSRPPCRARGNGSPG